MGLFFPKYSFLRLQNFISPSIKYPINLIFSVVICICKIYVFNGVIPCQIMQNFWIMSPLSLFFFFFLIFTSGRYHRDTKALKIWAFNSKHFRIFGILEKMANWCGSDDILDTTFSLITCLPNNLWSLKLTGVCFFTQEIQKWHRDSPET